jgi:hypothetical protein
VLDKTSYPTAALVDQEVAEYQGPALLAYNDAAFSDKDFDSLSRIGDSGKIQDGSTTGKFGRGFNAVSYLKTHNTSTTNFTGIQLDGLTVNYFTRPPTYT